MEKPTFKKSKSGLYKNTRLNGPDTYVGYIKERNEQDLAFYRKRMILLEEFFSHLLESLVVGVFARSRSELNVLDIGCGDGVVLKAIRRISKRKNIPVNLYGIDLDKNALKQVKIPANLKVASCTNMPYESDKFHLVLSSQTLEHLTESQIKSTISEIYRILAPGGVFYAETPNPESLLAKTMGKDWWMWLPEHLTLLPPYILEKMFKEYNFSKARGYTRMEIDKQINEIREIILRTNRGPLRLLPIRAKYIFLKIFTKIMDKGSITVVVASK